MIREFYINMSNEEIKWQNQDKKLEKCILHLERIKNWRCMKPFINLDILSSILKL